MQVTETLSDGLKREFRIVIAADRIETRIDEKLKGLAGDIRLPGFRPGRAPLPLLRRRFRKSVLGEVLDEEIRETVRSTMDERGLRPALEPKIEVTSFEDGGDLELSLAAEVLPEIEPVDFATLEVERLEAEADEAAVDGALERLAEQAKTTQPIAEPRPAQAGDVVVIDFVGRVDGEEFAGGSAEDYELELGTGSFIPGFEDQLVGVEPGAETEVKVTFPEDYGAEHLAGKEASFAVILKEIKEAQPAAIDDELAKRVGLESLGELRGRLKERIESEYAAVARNRLKRELFDRLDGLHEFEVPTGLVDEEFNAIWAQLKQQLEGPSAEEAREGKTDEELEAEYRRVAQRRVRLGLLLSEVGRRNNISIGQEELSQAMRAQAAGFPGQEHLVFEYYQKNPGALGQLQAPILEDKVVDFICELATVTTRKVTPDELMADLDEEGQKAEEAPAEA